MTWKQLYHIEFCSDVALQCVNPPDNKCTAHKQICYHLSQFDDANVNIEMLSMQLENLRGKSETLTCIEESCNFPINTLWLCMSQGCGYYGCGRRDNKHSKLHHELTGHPLYLKLNTLEIWCHTCTKWLGDEDSFIGEIQRAQEIRKYFVCNSTMWNPLSESKAEFDRRVLERNLTGSFEEDEDFRRYLLPKSWMKLWTRYVIGDEPPPNIPIDNSVFVVNGHLNLNHDGCCFVTASHWNYFKKNYGGHPTIYFQYSDQTRTFVRYYILDT